jgi:poly(A) polymerase
MKLDPAAWLDRPGVRHLLDTLDAADGCCRFVGGAVRDLALGSDISDLDLSTRFVPMEVIDRLAAAGIKAVPTGLAHGTITAITAGTVVEVTTLRADLATDGRRATVAFTDDWAADASRRDFTINALYADPLTGEVSDPAGQGLADLDARRVRFIGEPLVRIAEDHLRILRFFRFHARFGHGAPDAPALAACTARANDLMALSRERIAYELMNLLGLPDPVATLAIMIDHGIFRPVLPEITDPAPLAALILAEQEAGISADPLRRLASLLPRDPVIAEKIASRLKMSLKDRKRLAQAVDPTNFGSPQAFAYRLGNASAADRLLIDARPADAASIAAWALPRLPLGGGALIARGVPQGPLVAKTLQAIEQAWLDADFPTGDLFDAIVAEAIARILGSA